MKIIKILAAIGLGVILENKDKRNKVISTLDNLAKQTADSVKGVLSHEKVQSEVRNEQE